MEKNIYCLLLTLTLATFFAGCAHLGNREVSKVSSAGQHPELTGKEKLIACSTCHRYVTPDVYKSWFNSRHGLGEVKCFQCHGTFENLKVRPDETMCAACHNTQFQHSIYGKSCWTCHPAHAFTVHK